MIDSTSAPALIGIKATAKVLGIAEITARKQLQHGRFPLPTLKVGGRRMVRLADLQSFIQSAA